MRGVRFAPYALRPAVRAWRDDKGVFGTMTWLWIYPCIASSVERFSGGNLKNTINIPGWANRRYQRVLVAVTACGPHSSFSYGRREREHVRYIAYAKYISRGFKAHGELSLKLQFG